MRHVLRLASAIGMMWTVAATAGEPVREASTGIMFEETLDGGYHLLGTGVRKKFGFKIYAAALYVKLPEAAEALKGGKDPCDAIIRGSFPRRMILHFVLNVPGEKARDTFRENLDNVMSDEERAACVEDRLRYLDSLGGDIRKGERYVMDYHGGRIRVLIGGREVYQTSNRTLIHGIFRIWFGPRPLAEDLKKGLVARLPSVLGD